MIVIMSQFVMNCQNYPILKINNPFIIKLVTESNYHSSYAYKIIHF